MLLAIFICLVFTFNLVSGRLEKTIVNSSLVPMRVRQTLNVEAGTTGCSESVPSSTRCSAFSLTG